MMRHEALAADQSELRFPLNGKAVSIAGIPAAALEQGDPREAGFARNEGRLRCRRLRRLHGADRWQARLRLPHQRPASGRGLVGHHRRTLRLHARRHQAQGDISRQRCRAMWHLHPRHARRGRRFARGKSAAFRAEVKDALGGVLAVAPAIARSSRRCSRPLMRVPKPSITPEAGAAIGARIVRLDGKRKVDGSEIFGADGYPADALAGLRHPFALPSCPPSGSATLATGLLRGPESPAC